MATPLEKCMEDVGAKNRFPADMDAIWQRVVYLARLEKKKEPGGTDSFNCFYVGNVYSCCEIGRAHV